MNQSPPLIVGAGLAGLLAAHAWPMARVIELANGPAESHKALLRFRTDAAAKLTGTEFRKVLVRKSIYANGGHCRPDIRLCNLYAQKTLGVLRDRSIWNIDPAERFVAQDDWYFRLVDAVGDRISWATPYVPFKHDGPVISTMPMPAVLQVHKVAELWQSAAKFRRSPIVVRRWRVPSADVYQTVYFPEHDTPIYRASITGSLLIVEEVATMGREDAPLHHVAKAFGIDTDALEPMDSVEQKYGKVDELDPFLRKAILFQLTMGHNVYSLGRFATWRNILLDDVVEDIAVIKRLMNATTYDLNKFAHQ